MAGIFFILLLSIGCFFYDTSELTHHNKKGVVIDKWRAVGANVNYVTEQLVIDLQGQIIKESCSNDFYRFTIGDKVSYSFDSGRLGFQYNTKITLMN